MPESTILNTLLTCSSVTIHGSKSRGAGRLRAFSVGSSSCRRWAILTVAHQTVDALKDLGVDSLVFELCGNTPETGDYLSVMKQNIRTLQDAGLDR